LKHIDIDQGRIDQDARQVKTKFSKSFTTWFFPVGDDIRQIVVEWVQYLRQENHSFRKTLALLGGQICKSPEEYKAWSQNLGHENVLTTFSSYGDVAGHRQAEIIRALGNSVQPAVP